MTGSIRPANRLRSYKRKLQLSATTCETMLLRTRQRSVCVPPVCTNERSKRWKTENFALFQVLRQTLAERKGLSARCLKPRDFNGFEPPDFGKCTSRVYQCRERCAEFESHRRIRMARLLALRASPANRRRSWMPVASARGLLIFSLPTLAARSRRWAILRYSSASCMELISFGPCKICGYRR
jgi:hypothetical protein